MSQVTPVDEEFLFEGSIIISQTDLTGIITFANRKFCEVSGYSVDELPEDVSERRNPGGR